VLDLLAEGRGVFGRKRERRQGKDSAPTTSRDREKIKNERNFSKKMCAIGD